MKMNFKLLTLALAIPALNVQAVNFASVKESASKAIVSGKQKLNEAGKWVSSHKKEVAISAVTTVVVAATGLYIMKLRKDLALQVSQNKESIELQKKVDELSRVLYNLTGKHYSALQSLGELRDVVLALYSNLDLKKLLKDSKDSERIFKLISKSF